MKKIIAVMIEFILIMGIINLLCPLNVEAVSGAKMNISMPSKAKTGETVKVVVSIANATSGIGGIQGKIEYDTNIFEYVGKKCVLNNWSVTGFNEATGIFLAEVDNVGDESTYITGNKDVIEFEFKVKNNVTLGNTDVSISDIVLAGADEYNKETKASINISSDSNNNQSNINNTSNVNKSNKASIEKNKGTTTINSNTTGNTTTINANKSDKSIPETGSKSIIPMLIFFIIIFAVAIYKKCKKYKGI